MHPGDALRQLKKSQEDDLKANKRKHVVRDIKELEAKKVRIKQSATEETSVIDDQLKKLRDSLKNSP